MYDQLRARDGAGYGPQKKAGPGTETSVAAGASGFEIQESGVGDFHFNCFRGEFRSERKDEGKARVKEFYDNFTTVFNPNPAASVRKPSPDMDVIQFTGDAYLPLPGGIRVNLPDFHDDYVELSLLDTSFVGKTLMLTEHQSFAEWFEDASTDLGGWVASIGAKADALLIGPGLEKERLDEISRRWSVMGTIDTRQHFLTGSRSWTVGEKSDGMWFVETAGLEQYSQEAYTEPFLDNMLRSLIHSTWTSLVTNYLETLGAVVEVGPRPIVSRSGADRDDLISTTEVAAILKRHPGLAEYP